MADDRKASCISGSNPESDSNIIVTMPMAMPWHRYKYSQLCLKGVLNN